MIIEEISLQIHALGRRIGPHLIRNYSYIKKTLNITDEFVGESITIQMKDENQNFDEILPFLLLSIPGRIVSLSLLFS